MEQRQKWLVGQKHEKHQECGKLLAAAVRAAAKGGLAL